MLFKINQANQSLERIPSTWSPRELELESYLINRSDSDAVVLSEAVFGEPLLLVSNQVRTNANKRADILALDRAGNGVIIELKRNAGRLGIETQALQYLADFSRYRGIGFLGRFAKQPDVLQAAALGFIGGKGDVDVINKQSRVILVARSFDDAVFSLGEWLSSKGIAFRCISYFPAQIGGEKLMSFSVVFDRSPDALYPLIYGSLAREPGFYWHNIGRAEQAWWDFLVRNEQIPACFDDSPEERGEALLSKYIVGDVIIAYAKGYGAIGWGVIERPGTYRLVPVGDQCDVLQGKCRHRISVKWQAVASRLSDGLAAESVRSNFGIYHPISTSVSIDDIKGRQLIDRLSRKFSGPPVQEPIS